MQEAGGGLQTTLKHLRHQRGQQVAQDEDGCKELWLRKEQNAETGSNEP